MRRDKMKREEEEKAYRSVHYDDTFWENEWYLVRKFYAQNSFSQGGRVGLLVLFLRGTTLGSCFKVFVTIETKSSERTQK